MFKTYALIRPYPGGLPTANQYLAKIWDIKKFSTHRKKVAAAKAVIDNRPPTAHMHLHIKLKKLRNEAERLALIERDNRILLEKMAHIMRTGGLVDHKNYEFSTKSLNKAKRQRELLRITHENLAILKRLTTKEPHYNHKRWLLEYEANQQYLMNIAKHPHPWRKEQSPYKYLAMRKTKANKQIKKKVKSKPTSGETSEPYKTRTQASSEVQVKEEPACELQFTEESDTQSNPEKQTSPVVVIKTEPKDDREQKPTEGAKISVSTKVKAEEDKMATNKMAASPITISKEDYDAAVNVDLPKVETPSSTPDN